ncbi:hypothetical protein BHE74_00019677 [Ensete ventricosum]|uniref:Uncharacterized protein n=1 Tax=Ensete ventricosum TaxID=4639 RepID=A0A427AGM3_ENSVE|nr:hypothetical protein B296_00031348 [Ensete ventricosum]RWW18057.1 hypothetical protein GW17_00017976 [Ensete ventricosum]RWW72507.1 hypothetical protein BHE74_00019677 [Ensete ventricosum]RZR84436.1 hypothetical protein BHM03_00011272 [Ensete ventricosum]
MTNTAMEEDPHSDVSSSRERYAEFIKDSCCARYFLGPNPSIARFVYALIFLVTCLIAWTVRDYGRNALTELESWSSSLRCVLLTCMAQQSHRLASSLQDSKVVMVLDIVSARKVYSALASVASYPPRLSPFPVVLKMCCTLFFFVMFLSTMGTKKLEDSRNLWHSEWWPAKIIIWIGFMVVPFFIPSAFIQLYGKFAHFGAG